MWFLKILRMMFVTLDNAVYQCVDWLYKLFMMLAETGIFSSTDIRNFADRMYFFLGLIMIFKVSISIIQYIMNPDSVKDNKIGAPALLKNIVIILVGIVMIPYVFEAAYSLQRIVLKDNVIGSLILGMNYSSDDESKDMVQNAGNRMAFSTYTAFFHFDTAYISDECSNNPIKQDEKGNYLGEMSDACANDANRQGIDEFFNSNGADSFKKAYETLNMHKLYNDSIYNYTIKDLNGEEQFLFSYLIVITTLAGGFLAYILLLFCFDIAVRSVKLGFLQLIAPIPLIAKIDPKKGQETFNKWVKECISTYLQLFLRLASIYFAIFIISIIGKGMFNVVEPDKDWNNPFVFVFIIFGTLLFVKDLPKLIESITGMKLSGGGLSLKKKLGSVPGLGMAAAGVGTLAGNVYSGIKNKSGFGKTLRSALAGGASGMFRGARAELSGKNAFEATKIATKGAFDARNLREDRALAGDGGLSGIARRAVVSMENAFGVKSGISKFDKEIEILKGYSDFKAKLKNQADFDTTDLNQVAYDMNNKSHEAFLNKLTSPGNSKGLMNAASKGTKGLKQYYEDLKNSGTASVEEVSQARDLWESSQQFIVSNAEGFEMTNGQKKNNPSVKFIKEEAARYVDANKDVLSAVTVDKDGKSVAVVTNNPNATYEDINEGYIASQNKIVEIQSSKDYQQAVVNKKNDSKK